jgi:hypothetical protein
MLFCFWYFVGPLLTGPIGNWYQNGFLFYQCHYVAFLFTALLSKVCVDNEKHFLHCIKKNERTLVPSTVKSSSHHNGYNGYNGG